MAEIKLEENEVKFLRDFVKKGRKRARELTRARTLLLANRQRNDTEITEITAQACTESPYGHKRWTLTLLTEKIKRISINPHFHKSLYICFISGCLELGIYRNSQ